MIIQDSDMFLLQDKFLLQDNKFEWLKLSSPSNHSNTGQNSFIILDIPDRASSFLDLAYLPIIL